MYDHILVPVSFDNDRDAAGAMDVAKLLGSTAAQVVRHAPCAVHVVR